MKLFLDDGGAVVRAVSTGMGGTGRIGLDRGP